jgi:Mce-associated membrane protein
MSRLLGLYKPFGVALGLVLIALLLHPIAGRFRDDDGGTPHDRAVLDGVATTDVTGDVTTALTRIFSYTPTDVDAAQRAASQVLTGAAAAQYTKIFGQVRRQAPAQRVTLTTRVVRAGVISLTGDTARLLVFLDQTATRAGKADGTPAAAQLTVTARRDDGHWTITELKSA